MRLLSPRELADALGVSESSLKRWVDAGKIAAARTEGGHRRIAYSEAIRFIRETRAPLARPDLLGLPEVAAAVEHATSTDAFYQYLVDGDATLARGWLVARYLGGGALADLFDGPLRDAMHRLGELWQHEPEGVFVEHRATDICLRALAQLRNMFEAPADAPFAVGCGPEDDPYLIPSVLAAMIVTSAGLRAINLGPDTPASALERAIERHRPVLVWVSASAPIVPAFGKQLERVLRNVPESIVPVVGGRHGHELAGGGVRHVETMAELAAVAAGAARVRMA